MSAFRMTEDMLDALWLAYARAYSVVHDVAPLDDYRAGAQCSHHPRGGTRCTRGATHARGEKVYCDEHAARIRAQRAQVYARAARAFVAARDGITSRKEYDTALRNAGRRDTPAGVRSARPV